ncbi:adenosylhomocysteinase-like [Dermatophagoides farinae]|uniref:adenosylhomocysteinase-like n=1 Tax=Dermatophagoides farinae TaxID=6954 RepID=UPI003F64754B
MNVDQFQNARIFDWSKIETQSYVKDISLVALGQREIKLAEDEMPGLAAIVNEYKEVKPLKNIRISGCLHLTIQTAVLIKVLVSLGAKVRWCSCNMLSTQDHAAAAISTLDNVTVFAWKNENSYEYWWCVYQALFWPSSKPKSLEGPTLIIDDGADMTYLLHKLLVKKKIVKDISIDPNNFTDDDACVMLRKLYNDDQITNLLKNLKGICEETTTGIQRITSLFKSKLLKFPVMDINSSVIKCKFDNVYGCRQSLVDSIMRATDVMLAGKCALVCGYGEVGKGCCQSLRGLGMRVFVSEIDPICALQAQLEGYEVVKIETVLEKLSLVVTATGCCDAVLKDVDLTDLLRNAL